MFGTRIPRQRRTIAQTVAGDASATRRDPRQVGPASPRRRWRPGVRVTSVLATLVTTAAMLVAAPPAYASVGIEITDVRVPPTPTKNFTCTSDVLKVAVSAMVTSSAADAYMVRPSANVEADGMYGGWDRYSGATKETTFHVRLVPPEEYTRPSYGVYATVVNGGVTPAIAEKDIQ